MNPIQIPSLILPFPSVNLTSWQLIADLLVYNSLDIPIENLDEKTAFIWASEISPAGAPGPLWAWPELSPFPTSVSGNFWAAIGGGAGPSYPAVAALVPVAPLVITGTGVNGVVQTPMLRFLNHAPYARIRMQMPILGAAGSGWAVQVWFAGKG